ncbi:hypothetical protein CRG98_024232 [Punica granatum]|uniref:Uncharacterized protein n=1 Tax=Punica granatum TaxID=22663 RepID=A0A2I0JGJ7_PUNGR|nr:hypothetical protein CRG98_024232 [Punica granatum]
MGLYVQSASLDDVVGDGGQVLSLHHHRRSSSGHSVLWLDCLSLFLSTSESSAGDEHAVKEVDLSVVVAALFRGGGLLFSFGGRAFSLSGQIRGSEWRRPNNSSNSKRGGASYSTRPDPARPAGFQPT